MDGSGSFIGKCVMLKCPWWQTLIYLSLMFYTAVLWAATSGSTVVPRITSPVLPNIFILDTGFVAYATDSTTPQQYFYTRNVVCPSTHRPYVTITFSQINNTSFNPIHTLTGFGICINKLTYNGAGYTVGYLTTKRYNVAQKSTLFTTYTGFDVLTISSYVQLTGAPRQITPTRHVASDQVYPPAMGNIKWELFCYPTSLPPPYDQTYAPSVNSIGCYGLNLPLGDLGVPF